MTIGLNWKGHSRSAIPVLYRVIVVFGRAYKNSLDSYSVFHGVFEDVPTESIKGPKREMTQGFYSAVALGIRAVRYYGDIIFQGYIGFI